MTAELLTAWRGRSPREHRLLGVFALALAILVATLAAETVRRDTARLRARVARSERRLTAARMLAGRLESAAAVSPGEGGPTLVSLVETAVVEAVGAQRLARLEPGAGPDEATEARLVDVDLADVIHVLGALEDPARRLIVRDLELRDHPDDPARYDAALVVIRGRSS